MKKNSYLFLLLLLFVASSCSEDDSPTSHKGLIQFKPYILSSGLEYLKYNNNQILFIIEMQLTGSVNSLNVDIDYHLLDGTTKISEGKVKVNNDLGLGLFWGSNEHPITIDAVALKGKTLTVFLDPDNKHTSSQYTDPTSVNLYKKASIEIP